jgi:rhizosphere induced protein
VPGSGDTFKDIRLKFPDVNKFASTTQQYTYAFYAQSNTASEITVQLILIKNFGTNGDPQTETPITFLTIPVSYGAAQASFTFGTNIGKTIGPDGDDYLQLALRLPLNAVFSASFTDFILTPNAININDFPQTPDNEFIYQSLAGWANTPAYDGSSLYLPMVLTQEGMKFDDGEIGDVIAESQLSTYVNNLSPTTNRLEAFGQQYERIAYSPLGIPFNRLFNKYFNTTLNVPIYGTGSGYFLAMAGTAYSSLPNQLRVMNNDAGVVTNASDGTPATGFTFNTIHTGIAPASGYFCKSYQTGTIQFFIINNAPGGSAAPTAGTSGFTVGVIRSGTALLTQINFVNTVAATGLAGLYFEFDVFSGHQFYCWFKVDGAGADPAIPGRTGIEVDLNSVDTAAIVCQKISEALNGYQLTTIDTVAGSAVPAGSFFNINSTTTAYYVWYTVNGAGTDPAPSGKVGLQVDILSADTAVQVAVKTQIVINKKFFRVPDYRGLFLRGQDSGANIDTDVQRIGLVPGIFQDNIGTLQLSSNIDHTHLATTTISQQNGAFCDNAGAGNSDVTGGTTFDVFALTASTIIDGQGAAESRPINQYIKYVIKY